MVNPVADQCSAPAGMHTRAARLVSHPLELSYARSIFTPPNSIEVCEISPSPHSENITVVMGTALDETAPEAVFGEVEHLIMIVSAVLFTRDPRRRGFRLGFHEIYYRRPDGWWDMRETICPPGPGHAARSWHVHRVGDVDPSPDITRVDQALLDIAETEGVLDTLIALRGNPGWFDLWKATECLAREWKQMPQALRSAQSQADLDRFRSSATLHRHSPSDANWRQAKRRLEKWDTQPMSIVEASQAVARLLKLWLDWKLTRRGTRQVGLHEQRKMGSGGL